MRCATVWKFRLKIIMKPRRLNSGFQTDSFNIFTNYHLGLSWSSLLSWLILLPPPSMRFGHLPEILKNVQKKQVEETVLLWFVIKSYHALNHFVLIKFCIYKQWGLILSNKEFIIVAQIFCKLQTYKLFI